MHNAVVYEWMIGSGAVSQKNNCSVHNIRFCRTDQKSTTAGVLLLSPRVMIRKDKSAALSPKQVTWSQVCSGHVSGGAQFVCFTDALFMSTNSEHGIAVEVESRNKNVNVFLQQCLCRRGRKNKETIVMKSANLYTIWIWQFENEI